METAAKKIKIVKPGDNFSFRVPVPDLDRAEINAHSLHAITVKEYSNGQAGDKVHFNSCLEQSINRFRHVNHTFLCSEGMLSGTFRKEPVFPLGGQYSDR